MRDRKKDCRVVGSGDHSASFSEAPPKPARPARRSWRRLRRRPQADLKGRAESSARVRIIQENNTMAYIDGFVAAVPTQNRDAYRKHAEMAAPIFREHGALK